MLAVLLLLAVPQKTQPGPIQPPPAQPPNGVHHPVFNPPPPAQAHKRGVLPIPLPEKPQENAPGLIYPGAVQAPDQPQGASDAVVVRKPRFEPRPGAGTTEPIMVRVGEMVAVRGQEENIVQGVGLVVGLAGTGDSATAARQSILNMLQTQNIRLSLQDVNSANVAVVLVHPTQRCLVHQREVGVHTESFKRALRAALREDPDIVLVGEMRDLETIEIAIETAETGHLVFGTLHTTTAPSTVDRIIDQFPEERQAQIRTMLASSLKGVVAQTLCKKVGGGRVAALEVLAVNNAVSAQIREGKTYQIKNAMQTGGKLGMRLLNDALAELVQNGSVAPEEAYLKAVDKEDMQERLARQGIHLDTTGSATPAAAPAAPATAPQAPLPTQQAAPAPAAAPAPPPAAAPSPPPAPGGGGFGGGRSVRAVPQEPRELTLPPLSSTGSGRRCTGRRRPPRAGSRRSCGRGSRRSLGPGGAPARSLSVSAPPATPGRARAPRRRRRSAGSPRCARARSGRATPRGPCSSRPPRRSSGARGGTAGGASSGRR